jgi:activator of HSP90 ATPase
MTNIPVCDRPKHIRQSIERKKLLKNYRRYYREYKIELLNSHTKNIDLYENTNYLRFLLKKLNNIEKLLS